MCSIASQRLSLRWHKRGHVLYSTIFPWSQGSLWGLVPGIYTVPGALGILAPQWLLAEVKSSKPASQSC